MARLEGKNVNDVVVEMLAPLTGRNYFAAAAPQVEIQIVGTGAVKLQENPDSILVGERASNIGSQGPINRERIPDPAGWVDVVGGAVSAGTSPISPAVVARTIDQGYLRVVVTTAGTGEVTVITKWN